jgi:exosome complex exonuclease RRP6
MRAPGNTLFLAECEQVSHLYSRYVLSNRLLFKLAEQPPADMAGLLHAFSSTPPVVRRRAKDLLDVIRSAVKKGLSDVVEKPRKPPHLVSSERISESDKMDVDILQVDKVSLPPQSSLWSRNKALPTAATSSLFGTPMLGSSRLPIYSTPYSSLFGSVPPSTMSTVVPSTRFQDVVKKIHSALVVAPTLPTV